ncbi:MAG: nitroreductase family protein [Acidimicrobiales bacterium]
MELGQALRSTGAVRSFRSGPVSDEVVRRVLDTARFAPSGGNRQGWRVVVVKDPRARQSLQEIYLEAWYEYLAIRSAGLVPWAAITDLDAEQSSLAQARRFRAEADPKGFAETLATVPVLLLVLADLRALASVDRDLPRYTFAGGASIYPFVWNILLAARTEGLGGVITTVPVRREMALRELFGIPLEMAVAALVAMGEPERLTTRLSRHEVDEFTTIDRLDGPTLPPGKG